VANPQVIALITYRDAIMGPQHIRCYSETDFRENTLNLRHLAEMHLARDVRLYSCVEITDDVAVHGCVDITGGLS
jgi:hypothetical protein